MPGPGAGGRMRGGYLTEEEKANKPVVTKGLLIRIFSYLKPYCKEAIIILASEKKLAIEGKNLVLLQKLDYKKFKGIVKEWMKCAFYLGVIFSKSTVDHLSYFLGIEA